MNLTLADWEWTQTPEGSAVVACAPLDPDPAAIARLRKKRSAVQASVAIELARAREKASRKFEKEIAQRVVGDCAGVEMASSTAAARYKASRFVRTLGVGSSVVDLCCGIGGDSIELARTGLDVVGVDLDPSRAWMCERNAEVRTLACDVLDPSVPDGAFHIDPARRTEDGRRSRDLSTLQPGPHVWDELLRSRQHGAIKLHPGVHADDLPKGELEIISESGKLTQAILWCGKFVESQRRATLVDRVGSVVSQLVGAPDRPEQSTPIGSFIHTMDPSVERADLVGTLMESTGLQLVHPGTGLLTGEELCEHPMTVVFRVIESMPWNMGRVRSCLQSLDAGIVEIKSRAQAVNTDETQRALRGSGDRAFTVFVLPIAGRIRAIVCERVAQKATRPSVGPGVSQSEAS